MLLEAGKPDEAIRVLERAISLHSTSGQNYYYLAEAWLLKGNITQARECNRLASLYLEEEPEWRARVMAQRDRIMKRGR
ncbi:MAG: tetratricopeptide repeat protein [Proteobacteria bacterium]|nr:tetratricopeptide repeat protein [Pseudomonadota bacterium]